MNGCTNCGGNRYPQNILCHKCLDRYYKGEAVRGAFGQIQNFDGPPDSYIPPDGSQMELFKQEEPHP